MMIRIGIAAGEILNLLEGKKFPVSIPEIISRVDESIDVINMSIGWLIREDYVRVVQGGEKYLMLVPVEASGVLSGGAYAQV